MNEMTVLIVVIIAIFLVAAVVMVRIYKSLMDNPTPLDIELSSSAKYVIEGKTYYTENAAKARCLGILIEKK